MDKLTLPRLKGVAKKMGLHGYSKLNKSEVLKLIKKAVAGSPDVWRGTYINFAEPKKSRTWKEAPKRGDIYKWSGTRTNLRTKGRPASPNKGKKVKKEDAEEMKLLKKWHREMLKRKRDAKKGKIVEKKMEKREETLEPFIPYVSSIPVLSPELKRIYQKWLDKGTY